MANSSQTPVTPRLSHSGWQHNRSCRARTVKTNKIYCRPSLFTVSQIFKLKNWILHGFLGNFLLISELKSVSFYVLWLGPYFTRNWFRTHVCLQGYAQFSLGYIHLTVKNKSNILQTVFVHCSLSQIFKLQKWILYEIFSLFQNWNPFRSNFYGYFTMNWYWTHVD